MIAFRCQCGGKLEVPEKGLGMPARCAACGAFVRPVAPWGPLGKGDQEFFARLVIMAGPARVGEQIVLGGPGPIDIGKQSGLGLVLLGELVSRNHARLVREGDHWVLHDQQSTNGTGVNDQRIDRAQLRQGDRVRIGEYEFLFMTRSERIPSAAPDEDTSSAPVWPPPAIIPARPAGAGPAAEPVKRRRLSPRAIRVALGALLGAIVIAAGVFVFMLQPGESFMFTPGSFVRHPPVQTPMSDGKPWQAHGWTLAPLADFSADAVVLGKQSYDDAVTPLAKWNLAVGWGAMSDPGVVACIRMAQDARGLQVAFDKAPPVPWESLRSQMAVIYAIPATDGVLAAIEKLKQGDLIALHGKLVRAESPGHPPLVSNLQRGRAFTGQPDVMWVEAVTVRSAASQP